MAEWKSGLFGCCGTPGCCKGCCCPCCLYGDIVQTLPEDSGVCCAGNWFGACCGCYCLNGIPYIGICLSTGARMRVLAKPAAG